MDRLVYTAMTGAKHIMEQQATTAHNLANTSTVGFRSQLDAFRAVPVISEGLPTRTYVVDSTVGADFSPGPLQQTGKELDVAIVGKGWLVVDAADGKEAYTRAGSLKVSENGLLQTHSGLNVVGESGPITLPPDTKIAIAKDGTISAIQATGAATSEIVGKIKLVNPEENDLSRGDDGLFRTKSGKTADVDEAVSITTGFVEGSNVNIVETMVNMINLGRQFDIHMKLIQNADSNASKASQLLSLNG